MDILNLAQQISCLYIDPATTSYILQIAAGAVIAVGASVGIFWKKIVLWFKNKKNQAIENKIKREAKKH